MKNTRSRLPHDTLQTTLKAAFGLDQRRIAVLAALILAIIQARTVVLYALKNHVHLPGTRQVRYQRLLRFVQFPIPTNLLARAVLKLLPPGDVWLILDRTNWKFGKADINILLLSASWHGFSLPLAWVLLPHGGSSSQTDRIELLLNLLNACDRKVAGILADREFIGHEWFKFLRQKRIQPCIRLPATAPVNGMPVWTCFKKLQRGEVRVWHRELRVYGVPFRVLATKNQRGELLYLAYQGQAKQNLRRYAVRWQAENLHAALKSRGFNLEDTGLTVGARVSTLLVAVSVAFVWACVTGEMRARQAPLKRKKHGYVQVSVFRRGLDVLQDLLLHPSPRADRELAALIPSFEG